jgi:hypothetical protein
MLLISLYRSYFPKYQTINIVTNKRMLHIFNNYNFTKYCERPSIFNCGSLTVCLNNYITGKLFNYFYINFIPTRRSYFNDTEHSMYGYITYNSEYTLEKIYNRGTSYEYINYNSYRGITLELDTNKSKYTFKQYYAKLAYLKNYDFNNNNITTRLNNKQCRLPFKLKYHKEYKYQLVSNYFPGAIYTVVNNYDYIYNLATKVQKPIYLIKSIDINYLLNDGIHHILRCYICVVNYSDDLINNDEFYLLLDIAQHSENCILIIHVESFEVLKESKLLNYVNCYAYLQNN